MIQAILLIALGFLTASLIGVLIAPSLWNRAYRLSRKRLEQTLPISLSEIEAGQDQLKAAYAVRMRRLETALTSTKQKAAMQLVDNSRLQMQIVALKDQITGLDLKLSERRNAATVLELTITKRFPELDREITAVKQQLHERSYELQDLRNKLARRSEELEAAEKMAESYQGELNRLREALEKNSADRTGRRVRRASQWSLDDYRSEYDRLNLDLSRLRQQLAQLQDKDAQQTGVIKEELQKLAELILASAQPKPDARNVERAEQPLKRAEPRRDRPLPWPESTPAPLSPLPDASAKAEGQSDAAGTVTDGKDSPPAAPIVNLIPGAPAPVAESTSDGKSEGTESLNSFGSPRSKLLHDAVLSKASGQTVNPADGSSSVSTPGGTEAKEDPSHKAVHPSESPDRSHGRSLLERLQGAAEETAQADK